LSSAFRAGTRPAPTPDSDAAPASRTLPLPHFLRTFAASPRLGPRAVQSPPGRSRPRWRAACGCSPGPGGNVNPADARTGEVIEPRSRSRDGSARHAGPEAETPDARPRRRFPLRDQGRCEVKRSAVQKTLAFRASPVHDATTQQHEVAHRAIGLDRMKP
jgi:hypothetical protein